MAASTWASVYDFYIELLNNVRKRAQKPFVRELSKKQSEKRLSFRLKCGNITLLYHSNAMTEKVRVVSPAKRATSPAERVSSGSSTEVPSRAACANGYMPSSAGRVAPLSAASVVCCYPYSYRQNSGGTAEQNFQKASSLCGTEPFFFFAIWKGAE